MGALVKWLCEETHVPKVVSLNILDGHFFTYLFVVKFVMCVFEMTEINEKEARVGPFL